MCSGAGDVDLLVLVFPFFLAIIGGFLVLILLFIFFFLFLLSGSCFLPLGLLFPFWGGLGLLPFTKFFRCKVDKLQAGIGIKINASQVKDTSNG